MSVFDRDLQFISAASRTEKAPPMDQRLTHDELAFWLRRSRRYVSEMKRWGFRMEFDVLERREFATLQQAVEWLRAHPDFRVGREPPAPNAQKRA